MTRLFTLFIAVVFGTISSLSAQQHHKLGDDLIQALSAQPGGTHLVYALLKDRLDIQALDDDLRARQASVHERGVAVVTQLQGKAAATQPAFIRDLKDVPGVNAQSILPLWITNMVFFEATPAAILQLTSHAGIEQIELNSPVYFEQAEAEYGPPAPAAVPNGIEPGLRAIGAPELWAMGYTGYGRQLLVVDTGVEAEHPAIGRQYLYHNVPASHAWRGTTLAEDCNGHGTHVTGISVGLDRLTRDTIGVAFDAAWMSGIALGGDCNTTVTNVAGINSMFQWALNPDGDAETTADRPDVINNSWRSGSSNCDAPGVFDTYTALYAAGIAVIFSAGNEGPEESTITPPKFNNWDLVRLFAVGNVNANIAGLPISPSSSRGPSTCSGEGSLSIKPEVSAPGSSVRSAYIGGRYQQLSGTSMAAPHVAGAILLLKQAFPYLTGEDLMLALYFSATDLGEPGEDNVYGMGIINLPAAFDYLVQQGHAPQPPLAAANDVRLLKLDSPEYHCDGQVKLIVTVESAGADTIQSLQFTYSFGAATFSYDWAGTLAPGARMSIPLPAQTLAEGSYEAEVNIALANGLPDARSLDNRLKLLVRVINEPAPLASVAGEALCQGASALLRTNYEGPADIRWFSAPTQGALLGTGHTLLLSGLQSDATVYAEVSPHAQVGRNSPGASVSNGNQEQGLRFNAQHPFRLRSVKVYADEPGGRMVQLIRPDSSIVFKIVQIPSAGEHVVTLDLDIEPGNGYILRLRGDGRAFNFDNGGGHSYPYTVPGVMSITSSTLGSSRYFYFYDWDIQYVTRCGRTAVAVPLSSGTEAPELAITASADTLDLAMGGGSIALATSLSEALDWHWDFGDGSTATGQSVQHAYTQTGTYTVSHWAQTPEGCTVAAIRTVTVTDSSPVLSTSGALSPSTFRAFPNPADGRLHLAYQGSSTQQVRVSVIDLLGRQAIVQAHSVSPGQTIWLDIHALPAGTYILSVEMDGSRWVERIVKGR